MANFHEGRVELHRERRRNLAPWLTVLLSGMALIGGGGIAAAGPTGGRLVQGYGEIHQGGDVTVINQTSRFGVLPLIIDWQTFSTAPDETVIFNLASRGIAVNRVVGGVPSVLEGTLDSNGTVYILNSAGITFTGTSHVNVGALLATTASSVGYGNFMEMTDFRGHGSGQVINQGSIVVSKGGFAILAAPYVENSGFIEANVGTIILAGTNHFTLDFGYGDIIRFDVPPDAVEKIKADGNRVGVNNSGTLQAHRGQVLISASVATEIVKAAVNMSGVVDATAFDPSGNLRNGDGGSVLITSEGNINLTGRVDTSGTRTGDGGNIIVSAAQAVNTTGATLTAQGGPGGGKDGKIKTTSQDQLPLDPRIGVAYGTFAALLREGHVFDHFPPGGGRR